MGPDTVDGLDEFLRTSSTEQGGTDAETLDYARELIEGTIESLPALDEEIQTVAQNWQIERMAVIDRNVLRMAAFELIHCERIPPKVAINEGIELGKRFSTQNSGAFINGILDKIKNRALAKDTGTKTTEPATVD